MGQAKKPMRKQHHLAKPGASALAAGAAIAAGTQAYAAPIRFDNSPHGGAGHWHWPQHYLDVMESATDHPSSYFVPYSSLFRQDLRTLGGFYGGGDLDYADYHVVIGPRAGYGGVTFDSREVLVNFDYSVINTFYPGLANYYSLLSPVPQGTLIGPPPTGSSVIFDYMGLVYAPAFGSLLPDGVQAYLGVRFFPEQFRGPHYGWIGVRRQGMELEAFAWGYETEPGVPIAAGAVPEPETLAMLALGFVAARTRRRE